MSGGGFDYLDGESALSKPGDLAEAIRYLESWLARQPDSRHTFLNTETQKYLPATPIQLGMLHACLMRLKKLEARRVELQAEAMKLDGVLRALDYWSSGDSGPDAVLRAFEEMP